MRNQACLYILNYICTQNCILAIFKELGFQSNCENSHLFPHLCSVFFSTDTTCGKHAFLHDECHQIEKVAVSITE